MHVDQVKCWAEQVTIPTYRIGEPDKRERMDQQQRLFFVGCTRAMRYLFVTHDRWLASPFLEQLSNDRWQRVE